MKLYSQDECGMFMFSKCTFTHPALGHSLHHGKGLCLKGQIETKFMHFQCMDFKFRYTLTMKYLNNIRALKMDWNPYHHKGNCI